LTPIESRPFAELDPRTLYRILRLRAEVFVVEQECVFNDVDGRDEGAVHLWISGGNGAVSAAARLIPGPAEYELGRVVTARAHRGEGLAGRLVDAALGLVPPGCPVRINAQSRLEPWYGRWGFERSGPDFLEDGIVHVPMLRPGR
jgi:ElaA protein